MADHCRIVEIERTARGFANLDLELSPCSLGVRVALLRNVRFDEGN